MEEAPEGGKTWNEEKNCPAALGEYKRNPQSNYASPKSNINERMKK
jgi:hypothetical protein